MDPHALSGSGRDDGSHSPGVRTHFPTSPQLVVQPDTSRGEDVHVTRPQFPLKCSLFWSWSPKPSQLSPTACPHHVLGQRLSQRALSPQEDRPGGNGWRAMRGKAFQGLFCLCLTEEAGAGSSPAPSGPKSRCCEQQCCGDRDSGNTGHSWLHGPCFWLLHSPRK